MNSIPFVEEAQRVLALPLAFRVNRLGGYGASGEVIYEKHPVACPTVLVDKVAGATATFIFNGSVGMVVNPEDGSEVNVLDGHFDTNEKRETNTPSSNV